MHTRRKQPQVVYRRGKPTAVIIDIADYQELLERLEDQEDLRELEEIRKQPMEFVSFDDYFSEKR